MNAISMNFKRVNIPCTLLAAALFTGCSDQTAFSPLGPDQASPLSGTPARETVCLADTRFSIIPCQAGDIKAGDNLTLTIQNNVPGTSITRIDWSILSGGITFIYGGTNFRTVRADSAGPQTVAATVTFSNGGQGTNTYQFNVIPGKRHLRFSCNSPYIKTFPPQKHPEVFQVGLSILPSIGTAEFMATPEPGINDQNCFTFNGSDSPDWYKNGTWVRINNHICNNIQNENFRIEFWVKTTSTKTTNTVMDKRWWNCSGYHVALYQGAPQLLLPSSTGWRQYTAPKTVNDGQWHKIAISMVRTSTTGGNICVDNKVVFTFDPTGFQNCSFANSENLFLGRDLQNSANHFAGSLDEINIWID